jgi:hypothetical protein
MVNKQDLESLTEISYEEYCFEMEKYLSTVLQKYNEQVRKYNGMIEQHGIPSYLMHFYRSTNGYLMYTAKKKGQMGFQTRGKQHERLGYEGAKAIEAGKTD